MLLCSFYLPAPFANGSSASARLPAAVRDKPLIAGVARCPFCQLRQHACCPADLPVGLSRHAN